MSFWIWKWVQTTTSEQFSPEEINNSMSYFKSSNHIALLPNNQELLSVEDRKKMAILDHLCKTRQLALEQLSGLNMYSLHENLAARIKSKVKEVLINCLKS